MFAICNKHASLPAKNGKNSLLAKKISFIRSATGYKSGWLPLKIESSAII